MYFARYFHTLKYLKPIQIRYQAWYRIRRKVSKHAVFQYTKSKEAKWKILDFTPWINKPLSYTDHNIFTFLNNSFQYKNNKINWNDKQFGRLWAYNLNYMDYLLQLGMTKDTGLNIIKEFILNFAVNNTGKEPYPISLRGITWIKFLSKHKIHDLEINNNLYSQYKILQNNLEYHLLGNHLLENGFSMLFGAFCFSNIGFYKKAKVILQKELIEQILEDGGHFELSPMYHQIILDRLLDSINLLQNNQRFDNQNQLLSFLTEKALVMLSWLQQITFSNGDIPYFNDSTFGIAPNTYQLVDYAKRLNFNLNTNLKLSDSGYRKFTGSNYECIVDVGPVGPNYIPGHGHADMLSFVLYIDNKPIIIDTGISTYEKNNQRQLERSTPAHNTVVVDGKNQSDVWGGFRVGKRAKIRVLNDKVYYLEAEHNGYKPVVHSRSFDFIQSGIVISDVLSKNKVNANTYFHFHPDRRVEINGNTILVDDRYSLVFKTITDISMEIYNYPLGYNKYSQATKCKLTFQSKMQSQINTYEN